MIYLISESSLAITANGWQYENVGRFETPTFQFTTLFI